MKNYSDLLVKLHSLVIFRNLLSDEVIKKLITLLEADRSDAARHADLYCDAVSSLFKHSADLTEYIRQLVLSDENIYVKKYYSASCAPIEDSLNYELSVLEELSRLKAHDVQAAMPDGIYLPPWQTHDADFIELYKKYIENLASIGYGIFSRYSMFYYEDDRFVPVKYPDAQKLSDLCGYEYERSKVIANTEALLKNEKALNVLLYGDAGTGKSSTVKAIASHFFGRGLRLIEIKKNQIFKLPAIMEELYYNPLKFIIFLDDLSFNSNDSDFSALKAILEGSATSQNKNIVIYATSNRRHLVKENWGDRSGGDIHEADTRQEFLSLSARFGLTVTFLKPDKSLYLDIIHSLAEKYKLDIPPAKLENMAEADAIRRGGRSPRAAKQFVELLRLGIIQ